MKRKKNENNLLDWNLKKNLGLKKEVRKFERFSPAVYVLQTINRACIHLMFIILCRFRDGKVFDACSREVKAFPDIENILHKLHKEGYKLAAASEWVKTSHVITDSKPSL